MPLFGSTSSPDGNASAFFFFFPFPFFPPFLDFAGFVFMPSPPALSFPPATASSSAAAAAALPSNGNASMGTIVPGSNQILRRDMDILTIDASTVPGIGGGKTYEGYGYAEAGWWGEG